MKTNMNILVFLFCTYLFGCVSEKKEKARNDDTQEMTAIDSRREMSCDYEIPKNYEVATGAAVITGSDKDILVQAGAAITFTGENNVIFIRKGAVANIVGNNNFIYMGEGGAATITGTGNEVYLPKSAALTDTGTRTVINDCDYVDLHSEDSLQEDSDSKPSGIQTASTTISNIIENTTKITTELLSENIPLDKNNYLIGSWKVDRGRFNANNIQTNGNINLYPDGKGVQNYVIQLDGITIPQIAVFTWKRNGSQIYVDSDEDVVWILESSTKNKCQILIKLDDTQTAQLFLSRK